jgi:hypothetical protein
MKVQMRKESTKEAARTIFKPLCFLVQIVSQVELTAGICLLSIFNVQNLDF